MSAGSAGSVGQLQTPTGTGELDPTFVRALRLFHSTSKDAVHQLKAMLDEVVQGRSPSSVHRKASVSAVPAPVARDEPWKNVAETLKRDLNDLADSSGSAAKRARLHGSPGYSKSHTPSPSATPTPPTAAATSLSGNASSAGGEEDVDFGDLEGLNDLSCCICKNWAQGIGNKLMDCHTCQNLYHQACHTPVISDEEAGDPRLVWNCSQCKAPSKPKISGGSGLKSSSSGSMMKSRTGSATSTSSTAARSSSSDKHSSGGLGSSYKSSSGTSGSSKGSRSVTSSSYSKPSGGSTSGSGSSSSLTSADKRLQMMKKKAAQKRK